jgi:hypothetical protein
MITIEAKALARVMRLVPVVLVLASGGMSAMCNTAAAQEKKATAADLAKKVQNPIANLVTVPFQYNYNLGVGTHDRTMTNLNIQPVIPFPGDKWNVITRTIIPVNSVPVGTTGSVFGFGDISLSMFWSPAKPASLTWGLGPALSLPTSSNPEVLGSGKLSIGPTGVAFYGVGKFTMGAVASNVWSVAGDDTREDVNFFFAQWFINYNLGSGWALGSAPIITGNWNAPSGQGWVVPWGLQISKVTHLGTRPANLLIGYYYNATRPDAGAESQLRMQVNLMYP